MCLHSSRFSCSKLTGDQEFPGEPVTGTRRYHCRGKTGTRLSDWTTIHEEPQGNGVTSQNGQNICLTGHLQLKTKEGAEAGGMGLERRAIHMQMGSKSTFAWAGLGQWNAEGSLISRPPGSSPSWHTHTCHIVFVDVAGGSFILGTGSLFSFHV